MRLTLLRGEKGMNIDDLVHGYFLHNTTNNTYLPLNKETALFYEKNILLGNLNYHKVLVAYDFTKMKQHLISLSDDGK